MLGHYCYKSQDNGYSDGRQYFELQSVTPRGCWGGWQSLSPCLAQVVVTKNFCFKIIHRLKTILRKNGGKGKAKKSNSKPMQSEDDRNCVGLFHLLSQKGTELTLKHPPSTSSERISKQRSGADLKQKVPHFPQISVFRFVTVFLQDQVTAITVDSTIKKQKNCSRKIILYIDMKKRISLNASSSHVKNKKLELKCFR